MIEPLRIVDDAYERPVLCDSDKQTKNRKTEQQLIRWGTGREAEERRERDVLWIGETIDVVEHRRAKLMQAPEREVHLGFDADNALDPTGRSAFAEVFEEGRLPDASLAANDQDSALAVPPRPQNAVKRLAFSATTNQGIF